MSQRKGLRITICSLVLAIATMASIAIFVQGCNTTQSPIRQISDLQITTQVKAKLASDVRPSSLTNVDVNTTNGVVSPAGQVESAEVKRSAERVTASVPGVIRVNNNLQVTVASAAR